MPAGRPIPLKRIWLHDLWSFNGDGRFPRNRIKGKDKRKLQRWTRRRIEEDTRNEVI